MAIYQLKIKKVQRTVKVRNKKTGKKEVKRGRSSVSACCYRASIDGKDERTGRHYYYSKKRGTYHTELVGWDGTRLELWNLAEKTETRNDSLTAREIEFALPMEFTHDHKVEVSRQMAMEIRARFGCAVDLAIHLPDAPSISYDWDNLDAEGKPARVETKSVNWHCHLLMTTRTSDGMALGGKTIVLDNKFTGGKEIRWIRKRWEEIANAGLEKIGSDQRIDCRSLEERGGLRAKKIHVGPKATAEHRAGGMPWQIQHNLRVDALHQELKKNKKLWMEQAKLFKEYQQRVKELDVERERLITEKEDAEATAGMSPEQKLSREEANKLYKEFQLLKAAFGSAKVLKQITSETILKELVVEADKQHWFVEQARAARQDYERAHFFKRGEEYRKLHYRETQALKRAIAAEEKLAKARPAAAARAKQEAVQRALKIAEAQYNAIVFIRQNPKLAKYAGRDLAPAVIRTSIINENSGDGSDTVERRFSPSSIK